MKRAGFALLCFFLFFPATNAAAPAADPVDTYISTRDRYIAEFHNSDLDQTAHREHDRALADLSALLSAAVPPWRSPVFPGEGRSSIDNLVSAELGFGRLDGVVYSRGDIEVLVTTPSLLRRWIPDHNRWWQGEDDIPLALDAASQSEAFWTYAMFEDARAMLHGRVPVKIRGGAGAVLLAAYAQDIVGDAGPDTILAFVLRGNRVFVARRKLTAATSPHPVCEKKFRRTMARHADEQADRDYRTCFAAHLSEQPRYEAIRRQAQTLVDLLH